jgi:site-specific DNA-adenine methylase
MNPIVGYHGGKRRLLKHIRPLLPSEILRYVEPFVGMGAVYLDLRARGYVGDAMLADNNRCVADLWRILHGCDGDQLVCEVAKLDPTADAEVYYAALRQDEKDRVKRVARFLWITNYAYANVAPIYRGRGNGWVGSGCKLTSAAKWNKTFPWGKCVDRLVAVRRLLKGKRCVVLDDAQDVEIEPGDVVYADPPYFGRRGYTNKGQDNKEETDYAPMILGWPARCIVYSETRSLELVDGWSEIAVQVTARASRCQDAGAVGIRRERIYFRGGNGQCEVRGRR